MSLKFAVLLIVLSCLCCDLLRADTNFLVGADFSDLAFFESRGAVYKDGGVATDGIQILKNHGINCVRLRLFTSSQSQAANDPYNYINNTNYTVPLAVRVKNAGLLLCLDFHYSDTWADPGKQATPSAWTNLSFTNLVLQMQAYNSNTIATFAAAGAMPDYVQIGNEITDGMLWTNGQLSGTWNSSNPSWIRLGKLMKAAIQGVTDASTAAGATMPKIIVHIDRGGDWGTTQSYFDNLNAQGVPFDIIGESYYTFFHGPPANLNTCLSNAALRYNKPVLVAEDAFPWTNTMSSWTNSLYGFAPTIPGQVNFMAEMALIIKSVPNHLGMGILYWGAEYLAVSGVNEGGYNTSSFFDFSGNVLPVVDAEAGIGAPMAITSSISGGNLILRWPFSGAAAHLMTSPRLGPSASWTVAPNPVTVSGTVFTTSIPLTNSAFFCRLQSN